MRNNREILAFCHIIKTAGTSFTDLLKDNFGPGHLNVEPYAGNEVYTRRELERDLKFMPWLRSLAGHGLRPHIDYGDFEKQLRWITWFRDPVARLISGYQHGVEKNNLTTPFKQWLQEPGHQNLHVYFLTGDVNDLQGAKDMLIARNFFVGFVEHYDHSLAKLRQHFPQYEMDLGYTRKSNTAHSARNTESIRRHIDECRELVAENTALDIQLYHWAQERYLNSSSQPEAATIEIPNTTKPQLHRKLNSLTSSAIRHIAYKPLLSRF